MNLKKQLLKKNNCYITADIIVPKGVMWHSTAANNPYLKRYVQPDDGLLGKNPNNNHWNTALPDGVSKCVHAFIGRLNDGRTATYQTLPWVFRGWHCGGSGNGTHIGFEICEDDLKSKEYFSKVYKEACELTAYLCKMYNLDPLKDGVVICHSEGHKRGIASNHSDVMHWLPKYGKSMDTVRKDVADILNKANSADTSDLYKVQCGAFTRKDNANELVAKLRKKGFTAIVTKVGNTYKVQCGAFKKRANASALLNKLKAKGFNGFITK